MVLKSKVPIGIDIDSHNIRIIKMGKHATFNQCIADSIPEGLMHEGRIVSEDVLARHIRGIMGLNKIKGRKCALCLPSQHVITKVIFLPKMDKAILMENIYYDLKEYLPLSLDKYIIDYKIMDVSVSNGIEHWSILTVAVLKEVALSYTKMLKKAGLKPIYFDTPSNCLHKLLINFASLERQSILNNGNVCLVDLGPYYSNIVIFHKGSYFVEKTVLTQTDLRQVLDEILRVIRYYNNQVQSNSGLDNVVLFGEQTKSLDLMQLIKDNIKVDVALYTDWIESKEISSGGLEAQDLMVLGKAIGATIRRIS